MKVHKNTPTWAVELVTQVCKDYRRALPRELKWWLGKPHYFSANNTSGYELKRSEQSSGICGHSRIKITAGTNEAETKVVLLHELAHHIRQRIRPKHSVYFRSSRHRYYEGHTMRFWRLAYQLYERYGCDMELAYEREKDYKVGAKKAYAEYLARKG